MLQTYIANFSVNALQLSDRSLAKKFLGPSRYARREDQDDLSKYGPRYRVSLKKIFSESLFCETIITAQLPPGAPFRLSLSNFLARGRNIVPGTPFLLLTKIEISVSIAAIVCLSVAPSDGRGSVCKSVAYLAHHVLLVKPCRLCRGKLPWGGRRVD